MLADCSDGQTLDLNDVMVNLNVVVLSFYCYDYFVVVVVVIVILLLQFSDINLKTVN